MGKRVSTRRIRKHRQYAYYEAADELGVTVQTLRAWRKQGLRVMTGSRPHLILGEDLISFVDGRQKPRKRMAPNQFRCFRCSGLTKPLDGIAFYVPSTPTRGTLECMCETCEGPCSKFAGEQSLTALGQFFEIVRNDSSQV